ncbi:aspartyl/asparaginyl beta-hydroxylase domain-containing protein [Streptomyces meridianus]|uniref:Aspartyl/asparaginyl beta-hydroxylase domain-containing protein n=1 Tax=Streptomyces meridianus TaxID=2938945 RepID=A0ABT0XDE7_9ACTN|nr:aspartyl/asparaginyl beta-hydroxylase domain-containing protein [Streptomyces meridianus]MCM2579737.1 aspartyl/asparaginyl beta-hydroxylase domain-containing protein [Streptomyces meridianus]
MDTLTALTGQIAQLDAVNSAQVERMRHEALTAQAPWKAEYSAYQSGGWWTTSLMSASGDAADVTIGDCAARPTVLLAQMPTIAALLAELGLNYMWVRLARLEANAFLWEHRDYDELDQVERHRLHIPLHTNTSAFLVTGGTKVHMAGGRIWRLTPTYAHGVCNLLGPDRIHLIADVYADDAYRRLARRPSLHPGAVEPLPAANRSMLTERLQAARGMADLGYTEAAERMLLRLFYTYALPEGAVYDLIAELHTSLGDEEAATRWTSAKRRLLALTA